MQNLQIIAKEVNMVKKIQAAHFTFMPSCRLFNNCYYLFSFRLYRLLLIFCLLKEEENVSFVFHARDD